MVAKIRYADSGRATQARGRERRSALAQAARALLARKPIQSLSMAEIAGAAGIPVSSAYHFYPDIEALFLSIVREFEAELLEWQGNLPEVGADRWQDVVSRYIIHGAAFFGDRPAATQLMLGPYTAPAIKLSDRDNDYAIAMHLLSQIRKLFTVPELAYLPDAFFHAIEIADVFFSLSVIRHGVIMPHYVVEATRAAVAYLEIYLPSVLLSQPNQAQSSSGPPAFTPLQKS